MNLQRKLSVKITLVTSSVLLQLETLLFRGNAERKSQTLKKGGGSVLRNIIQRFGFVLCSQQKWKSKYRRWTASLITFCYIVWSWIQERFPFCSRLSASAANGFFVKNYKIEFYPRIIFFISFSSRVLEILTLLTKLKMHSKSCNLKRLYLKCRTGRHFEIVAPSSNFFFKDFEIF